MRILIIGGGIGGLTLALACKHFGLDYEVYEAAPQIKEAGAGIWVPPNAMEVMKRLGMTEAIIQAGYPLQKAYLGASEADIWYTIDFLKLKERLGSQNVAIHRGKLQGLLYQAIESSKVHTDKKLTKLKQDNNKVTATFEDGSEATGDCLIGADGIHSTTRRLLFGELPLRYSGQTCWRGVVDYKLPEDKDEFMFELWGKRPGQRFAQSYISEGQVYYYGTMAMPAGGKDDVSTIKQTLHQYFDSFGAVAHSIIEAVDPRTVIRTDLYDLKPITTWVKGNIALMGDAAHATTPNMGQGAAQAMEDAYVLASGLSKGAAISEALQHYQQKRIKKAHFIVNNSWMIAKMGNIKNPALVAARNFMMRHTPDSVTRVRLEKAYKTDIF